MNIPQWHYDLARTAEMMCADLDLWLTAHNPSAPQKPDKVQRWRRACVDGLKQDAELWRWGEVHIVKPLEALQVEWTTEAPARVGEIRSRLERLANVLREGRSFDALVWDVRASAQAMGDPAPPVLDPLRIAMAGENPWPGLLRLPKPPSDWDWHDGGASLPAPAARVLRESGVMTNDDVEALGRRDRQRAYRENALQWSGENLSKPEVEERRRHLRWAITHQWAEWDEQDMPRLTDSGKRAANPTPTEAAARRLNESVQQWRRDREAGGITVDCRPGQRVKVNPGPSLSSTDLDVVAGIGAIGAAMVERLRAWREAERAEEGGPADAMGFLRTLADHGEAEALKRWPSLTSKSHQTVTNLDKPRQILSATLQRLDKRERAIYEQAFRDLPPHDQVDQRLALVERLLSPEDRADPFNVRWERHTATPLTDELLADPEREKCRSEAFLAASVLGDNTPGEARSRWPASAPPMAPLDEAQLSDTDKAIAKAIRARPGITGRQIADEVHTSVSNVKKRLSSGSKLRLLGFYCPQGMKGYCPPRTVQ